MTLLSACSPTASVFLVMAAYRTAAAAWRMRALPLPATGTPTVAVWVQARFSGCGPTFHPLFLVFLASTSSNILPLPPLPCRCTCLPGYLGNGKVCYGSIMQQLNELNTKFGSRWSGQLSRAISLFSRSTATNLSAAAS